MSLYIRFEGNVQPQSVMPNNSKYGLHTAALGTDLQRARRVVIKGMTDDPLAPWGGFKFSGVGREYGRYGIDAFLETRAILES